MNRERGTTLAPAQGRERRCEPWLLRTELNGPIALLLIMLPVSVWVSCDRRYSLMRAAFVCLGIATFYGTVWYANNRSSLFRLVVVYLALGTGAALLGLVGTNWRDKSALPASFTDSLPVLVRGLVGAPLGIHPNEVAGVLLWFLPLQMVLLAWLWKDGRGRSSWGVLLACSTFLHAVVILFTQSRGAWLGLLIAVVLVASVLDRRVRAALMLLGAFALPASAMATSRVGGVVAILERAGRLVIWRVAVQAIRDMPFTGVGLGTFRWVARALYTVDVEPAFDIAHAHNSLLQAGVDLGMVGLLAYAGLSLAVARRAWSLVHTTHGPLRALALGLAAGLVSTFVYGLSDCVALTARPAPLRWMMLGLVVATSRLACRREDDHGA